MKKTLLIAAFVVAVALAKVWAGHFTDILPPASAYGCVPVSNGYDYNCSTDSGAPAMTAAAPITPWSRTSTQVNSLAATTTGQILFCSNCTRSFVCVSSGVVAGSWVVAVETGTMTSPTHCQ